MVDFKRLVREKKHVNLRDLADVFESLDRQSSHLELRKVQTEALQALTQRRQDRDIVLKVSTGSGKTSIALLYLYSLMEELKRPVLYLCPTTQLVTQVCDEAAKLGVNAIVYPSGEPHPHVDGITGKAIIVCTYDKLFNAKTTFDRSDVMLRPCAIVLDDAHAGVGELRDAYTVRMGRGTLFAELIDVLGRGCESLNRSGWQDIRDGDANRMVEIPFWIWASLRVDLEKVLAAHHDDPELRFVWGHLRGILRWCRCIVSGQFIEIVPDVLPVQKSAAFSEASHRLFMSATLADDSVLVREFDCSPAAAATPIRPITDRGLGERMVLAPSLVDPSLDRKWVMEVCQRLSSKYRVVVLSPSERVAREWEQVGATVVLRDDVPKAVAGLRDNSSALRFVVLVQRYDGIDLPDHACRVLVMDGMPYGQSLTDTNDSGLTAMVEGPRCGLVYRIEQGMGRAVRSHVDYAVVLLVGPELAHFIAKHDVLAAMTPETQAQLRQALDLAKLASQERDLGKAVRDMMRQCLERDEGWKQYYAEAMGDVPKHSDSTEISHRISISAAERLAFKSAMANSPQDSIKILRSAIDEHVSDERTAGWYLQKVANYMHDFDPGQALEVQRVAFQKNNSMICPPGVILRPILSTTDSVSVRIARWLGQFANPNGAIARIQELRLHLSYDVSPAEFEQGLMDLAALVGAEGSRPEKEYGEGPDDLWLWPDAALVIEAKTENEKTLHKRDAGQLLLSLEWFKKQFPMREGKVTPLIASRVTKPDGSATFPDDTRVLLPEGLAKLLDSLEKFYRRLIAEPLLVSTPKSMSLALQEFGLAPVQFVSTFASKLER